ncbi:formyl-CoA transferase [Jatrophihabitans sp. GAS493]|uniref:CaiB/BaiF CoA transferase family protein n=1 Tax=Jatrophihabitans sp. GAS493 TaxID=1907575 RepID=UPI000BBF5E31|nr:CoA transferase [Jatrophihabitans sp. GAS493]SOD71759.1 formyl-CoA transferase [Jatrophihabitans sp. GAS493]
MIPNAALCCLDDVHVLDFGMNIAGPQSTSLLSDLGADVIKVESPQGDTSRSFTPKVAGLSAMFAAMNRNKRYLALDLTHPNAAEVLDPLLRWADVVVQNLRPGKAGELGISAEQCHDINPRIVHASVEAFYPAELTRPGYDLLVQAETGMMSLTGDPDGEPSRLPGSILDHVTGLWTAFGVLAALNGTRDRVALNISMSDVAQTLLADRVSAYLLSGDVPTRMGSAIGTSTPLQAYPTADGEIVVGAVSDALFRRLCAVVAPDLNQEPEFETVGGRVAHRDELNRRLSAAFAGDSAQAWYDRLDAVGVPVGRVRTMPDAVARHRELSRTGLVEVPGMEGMEVVANPLGMRQSLPCPGALGADSESIATELLGLSKEQVQTLVADGVVLHR